MLGACFVMPAGVIYRRMKTRKGALMGCIVGAAIMAVLSVPINYFVTYPIYAKILPIETIIELYQAIIPSVNGLLSCLVVFNMPFTFLKGIIDSVLTFIIYKRISPIIKGHH